MTAQGFAGEKFVTVRYYEAGATGSGKYESDPAALDDADVMSLLAGTYVERAYVIVDVAVTGATTLDLGDDDDADGYVPNASVTLGTPGIYGMAHAQRGAYTADGASKRYSATGKEVKLALDSAASAGKVRVVVEGLYLGR